MKKAGDTTAFPLEVRIGWKESPCRDVGSSKGSASLPVLNWRLVAICFCRLLAFVLFWQLLGFVVAMGARVQPPRDSTDHHFPISSQVVRLLGWMIGQRCQADRPQSTITVQQSGQATGSGERKGKGKLTSRRGQAPKRRRKSDSDSGGDGEGESDPEDVNQSDSLQGISRPKASLFACHFYKFDPLFYYRCVEKHKHKNFKDVKQHIKRCHTLTKHYCPTCWTRFGTGKKGRNDWEKHLTARRCKKEVEHPEDLREEEFKALEDKLEANRAKSDEEKWFSAWDEIFGQGQHPRPTSVYVEDGIREPAKILRSENRESLRAKLPIILSRYGLTGLELNMQSALENEIIEAAFQDPTNGSNPPGRRGYRRQPLADFPVAHSGIGQATPPLLPPTLMGFSTAQVVSPRQEWGEHRTSPSIVLPFIAEPHGIGFAANLGYNQNYCHGPQGADMEYFGAFDQLSDMPDLVQPAPQGSGIHADEDGLQ